MIRRIASVLVATTAVAQGQPAPSPAPTVPAPEAVTDPEPEEVEDNTPERVDELNSRIEKLEQRLEQSERNAKAKFPLRLSGYGDVGFFVTQGDGTGFRQDFGHTAFPARDDFAWVFYGDLLATQINSRGEVADLGRTPGVDRFDSVHSGGAATFLVNELNLTINAGLGKSALFNSSVNFTPRTGTEFALGDTFDVDLVQLEWQPTDDGKTSLFVGKVDSVIGIEYKARKAPQRFGVTPTLLARYTVGTAVGVKARTKLADDRIILAAAATNGNFVVEQFHFSREVDTNDAKTLSGRAAVRLPFGDSRAELGVSGSYGVQDGAQSGTMWFAGADLEVDTSRVLVRAQWLKGRVPGDTVSGAYKLDLRQAAYLEADFLVTPIIGVLARGEFRDAEVSQAMDRLYITKNWRATTGVRLIFNPNAMVKAEYSHNGEYGAVPSIPDDVVTTSVVMAF